MGREDPSVWPYVLGSVLAAGYMGLQSSTHHISAGDRLPDCPWISSTPDHPMVNTLSTSLDKPGVRGGVIWQTVVCKEHMTLTTLGESAVQAGCSQTHDHQPCRSSWHPLVPTDTLRCLIFQITPSGQSVCIKWYLIVLVGISLNFWSLKKKNHLSIGLCAALFKLWCCIQLRGWRSWSEPISRPALPTQILYKPHM